MTTFPAYATNFALHPEEGEATRHLAPLVKNLGRLNFVYRVADPRANQGQMDSDFDARLEGAFASCGAVPFHLTLPAGVPQELDFAFGFGGGTVAVEIEKSNREKILRDLLKCHIYLRAGAQFALVVLPRNYAHKHGEWNLFKFGVERYDECRAYAFGSPDTLGRIALLGFDQYEAAKNRPMTKAIREEMRAAAAVLSKAN
jgi:hypothetical protein